MPWKMNRPPHTKVMGALGKVALHLYHLPIRITWVDIPSQLEAKLLAFYLDAEGLIVGTVLTLG